MFALVPETPTLIIGAETNSCDSVILQDIKDNSPSNSSLFTALTE